MITNEIILDAIGMIDEEAVQDAKEYKRARFHLSRAALIAACLCVALVGTALAAEMIWGVFSEGTRNHPNAEHLGRFEFSMQGTTCFELDEILADIEVLAAQRDNSQEQLTDGRANVAAFESWEKAGEYIGIPLADNAVLAQYPQAESLVGPTTDEKGTPLFLYVSTDYLVDDVTVWVNAYLRTDHAGHESSYTPGISYDRSSVTVVERAYQMSDGSSGIIFNYYDESFASYNGTFVQDGILYWVSIYTDSGQDDTLEQLMENIMAAY